jgi:hypothetical protein
MDRNEFFIVFPNGDTQPVLNKLSFGNLVDMNGNIIAGNKLNPNRLTYRVCGLSKKIHFKDVSWYFKLEQLTADDVDGEIDFHETLNRKRKIESKFNNVMDKLEKKYKKR